MAAPCVGIFWGCRRQDGSLALLADKTPIDQAEEYGDCRTHPTGHAEFWEGMARLGPAKLERGGFPTAPAWYPYDALPRGRVVYLPIDDRFIIYADYRLRRAAFIAQIVAAFGVSEGRYVVMGDPHYRAVCDLGRN